MRKVVVILMLVVIIGCGVCLTACDGTANAPKAQFSVRLDGGDKQYSVVLGEQAVIDIPTKKGYAFDGATDANGVEYFNRNGKSLRVWDENMPTVFYPKFKNADGVNAKFGPVYSDEALTVSDRTIRLQYTFDNYGDFLSVIRGDLDRRIGVEIKFRSTGWGNFLYSQTLHMKIIAADEPIISKSYTTKDQSFVERYEVTVVKASYLVKGFTVQFVTQLSNISLFVKDVEVIFTVMRNYDED